MANSRIGIFLQVRLDSKRLNRKALLPLINGNVIEHAMRALRNVRADVYALLTDKESANELKEFAEKESFEVFAGPGDDVLKRYILAAEKYKTDCIVRATGDNPLVSAILAQQIIEIHLKESADLSHYINMPLGTGVEVISCKALKTADMNAEEAYEREHITQYIYRNKDKYRIIEQSCDKDFYLPGLKISLDTNDDYTKMKRLYNDIYYFEPIEIDKVVEWLKRADNTGAGFEKEYFKTGLKKI
jgi:spore coat polysaccharide biosynthesis protein SpsF